MRFGHFSLTEKIFLETTEIYFLNKTIFTFFVMLKTFQNILVAV